MLSEDIKNKIDKMIDDIILEESKHSFSSTQINILDEKLKSKILNLGSLIKDEDLYNEEGYGRDLVPHITVKYGIHTSDIKEIKNVMKSFNKKEIKFSLKEISKFENELYDVVIIKVDSEDLTELNKLINDNIENTTTYPVYTPHITLAYVRKGIVYKGIIWKL